MPLISTTLSPDKTVPNKSSSFGAWLQWYKSMENRYGKIAANDVFSYVWNKRQPVSWSAVIDFGNRHELISYLANNGLKLDQNSLDSITGFGYNIADTIMGTLKIGKWAFYIGGAFVALIFIAVGVSIIKNPNEAIGAASTGLKYA